MGVFAITGGTSGIGAKTIEMLSEQGHKVINIDFNKGDITANLATDEGRNFVISELHRLCPDGLDGIVCCAGVNGSAPLKLIVSLNYFGVVKVCDGVYDLLQKKNGACVIIASNTIMQTVVRKDIANLLNDRADEKRILALMDNFDSARDGHAMYVTSKYAVSRWMRRVSADWAAHGVRINAIAPGNVETAMTKKLSPQERYAMMALPIPTLYGQDKIMDPEDIANAIIFLVTPIGHGVNGVVLFCDGGTDALLNSEKVY